MEINIQKNFFQKRIKLPPLGLRILKTGTAVFLCLLIYNLRGFQGMVSQSCVAAIICMQPYRKDEIRLSLIRITGTLMGAAWGLLFLQCMKWLPVFSEHMLAVYALMAVGVIVTLYSTVILKKTSSAALAAIVFVSVVVNYPDLEEPVVQAWERVFDTLIGVGIAYVLNSVSLPREKHREYVFFVQLQNLVPSRFSQVAPRILVQLNRLYDAGARISLVSKWAPAFLLGQMGTMDVNMPVIVMDGAAMYDIPNKRYLDVHPIPRDTLEELENILREIQTSYCIYAVQESNMFLYRRGPWSQVEEDAYNRMKRSPYRNYVEGDPAPEDQIALLRILDTDRGIDAVEEKLRTMLPLDRVRMARRILPHQEGCSGLYIYDSSATVEQCKKDLVGYLRENGEEDVVPVDIILDDLYSERGAVHLLNGIRNIYAPVSVRSVLKYFKGRLN